MYLRPAAVHCRLASTSGGGGGIRGLGEHVEPWPAQPRGLGDWSTALAPTPGS